MKRNLIIVTLMIALMSSPYARAGETGRCIDNWSVAKRIVEQESLTPVEQVRDAVQKAQPGTIVKAMLCELRGAYTYKLTVRAPEGQFKNLTIDARANAGGK